MIFAYRDTKGAVRYQVMPTYEQLERQPDVLEILGEIGNIPGPGEKLDPVTLKVVADATPAQFDAKAEIEALKARVEALEKR